MQLFASDDVTEIELPELAREPERGPTLIQIRDEFEAESAPEASESDVSAKGTKPHVRVEWEVNSPFDEAVERVTAQVVTVREVCGKVRV